ncbi:DNA glycosylase AlkZ-like family protein [Nonomuraea sp. NPDC002799]
MPVVSLRALNRTLLERQMLISRTSRPALEVVEHLVAMQGQEPNWPYVGLWARIAGFSHEHLASLLSDRSVVRSTVLRSTQHLVSADDFRWLRPVVQPVLDRTVRAPYFAQATAGLELSEIAGTGRDLLADRTRVIDDQDRRRVMLGRAMVHPTFLIDGFVHGTWSLKGTTLLVSPFRPLSTADTTAVLEEAERLHPFLTPATERHIALV